MDWLDLLAAQGILKSLLQHYSSKEPIFRHSAFFTVQLTSIHDHWKNHSLDQMDLCWQTNVSEISPRCSLEGLMLKLKLQYFGHLMRRVDSLEKTLMLGGIGGGRRRGRQRMRWLDGITDSMGMSLSKFREFE